MIGRSVGSCFVLGGEMDALVERFVLEDREMEEEPLTFSLWKPKWFSEPANPKLPFRYSEILNFET